MHDSECSRTLDFTGSKKSKNNVVDSPRDENSRGNEINALKTRIDYHLKSRGVYEKLRAGLYIILSSGSLAHALSHERLNSCACCFNLQSSPSLRRTQMETRNLSSIRLCVPWNVFQTWRTTLFQSNLSKMIKSGS